MTKRTCFELGACQSRKPACQGCSWQLAPGTIVGPYHRRTRLARFMAERVRPKVKLVLLLAYLAVAAGSVAAFAGFLMGYFASSLGWLP